MKLHIGLIGAGSIGLVHLLSLRQIIKDNLISKPGIEIKIKSVADIDEKKLNNLKRNNPYNVDNFTTNPDEIIRDKTVPFSHRLNILLYLLLKPNYLIRTIKNVYKIFPYFKKYDFDIIIGGGAWANVVLLIFILSRF